MAVPPDPDSSRGTTRPLISSRRALTCPAGADGAVVPDLRGLDDRP